MMHFDWIFFLIQFFLIRIFPSHKTLILNFITYLTLQVTSPMPRTTPLPKSHTYLHLQGPPPRLPKLILFERSLKVTTSAVI